MEETKTIAIALIIVGLIILLHHFIFWQRIADLKDVLHHEFFAAISLTAGITLLMTIRYNKGRNEQR